MSTKGKNLSPRQELLQIQKRLFRRNADFIRKQTMIRHGEFESYEKTYKRKVSRYENISDIHAVMAQVDESDIIYIGDYHTNRQSQRFFLRLLKLIIQKYPDISIGLELMQSRHQNKINSFLDGTIDEGTFLKKVHFDKYWGSHLWSNFKAIFDFARYHEIPIIGIEAADDIMARLKNRDQKSAAVMVEYLKDNPGRKFIILIGELHISPQHLPGEVQKKLKKNHLKKRDFIIYQNCEALYWKLAEKKLEQKVEVVRIDKKSFCVINTPPIIWQQTYIQSIEHEGEGIDYLDAQQNFIELVRQIAGFLDLTLPKDMDEVEVFTSGDLSFLERLREEEQFSAREIRVIKNQILDSQSYFIPKMRYVYLGDLSINHAAEEATHYVRTLCAGEEFERGLQDAFYVNILHECLGFFGSKIINHKRKCFHQKDYKDLINYLKSVRLTKEKTFELEMAYLILEHYQLEKKGRPVESPKVLKSDSKLFFAVTHGIGYSLGDRLYYGLVNKVVSKEEIRDLFHDPFRADGVPFKIFIGLSRALRQVKIPKRL
jgi:uncharacterized iron-regulated protein